MMPSTPYCSANSRPFWRSGISPLIVIVVCGATRSRIAIICGMTSQWASTLLISFRVRKWMERFAMSCSNKCVIHASISAISVNPMRVLTLTGKPPALAASINSAATSGRKINPLPFPRSATLGTGQPIFISNPWKPISATPILISRKNSGLSPQICATIGCSSSVKTRRPRTLSFPSGWQ